MRTTILIFLVLIILPSILFAKDVGYLICSDGNVLTVDLVSNEILTSKSLEDIVWVAEGKRSVFVNQSYNSLIVVNGKYNSKVDVFNLQTFEKIKTLDGVSSDGEVDIIANKYSDYFYIDWYDGDKDTSYFSEYSFSELKKTKDLEQIDISENTYISDDNLYFIVPDLNSKIIYKYRINDSIKVETIDFSSSISDGVFSYDIEDEIDGYFLIGENHKNELSENSKYSIRTYAVNSKTSSKIINTEIVGDIYFGGNHDVAIVDEKSYEINDGSIYDAVSIGKLHVYNMKEGAELGSISYPVNGESSVVGAIDSSDYVYILSKVDSENYLIVLDISNLSVKKQLKVPGNVTHFIIN